MQGNQTKSFIIIVILIVIAVGGILFAKNKTAKTDTGNNQVASDTDTSGTVAGTDTTSPATNTQAKETDIILFYGSTCPHCKKVEDFIKANNITNYIKFQNLEVYENTSNANLMQKKQDQCKNLSEDDKGGVPFLYSSEKCVVGDQPVIDFLKQKAGI